MMLVLALVGKFSATKEHSPSTFRDTHLQMGEQFNDENISIKVHAVRIDEIDIDGVWELTNGDRFVLLDISLKNKTSFTYHFSPITFMEIFDSEGKKYGVSSAPSIQNPLGGPISAGEEVRGEVGFILPRRVNTATLVYKPGLIFNQEITIDFSI